MQIGDRVELIEARNDLRRRTDVNAGQRGTIVGVGEYDAGHPYWYVNIDSGPNRADIWEHNLRVIQTHHNGMVKRKWPIIASSSPVVDPDDHNTEREQQLELATEPMYLAEEGGNIEGLRVCVHPRGFHGEMPTNGKPVARLIEGAFPRNGVEHARIVLEKDCMEEWIRAVYTLLNQGRSEHGNMIEFTVMTAHGPTRALTGDPDKLTEWIAEVSVFTTTPQEAAIQRVDQLATMYTDIYARVYCPVTRNVSYWEVHRVEGARTYALQVPRDDHTENLLSKLTIYP